MFVVRCADEESEDVGMEPVGDERFIGQILEANRNLTCCAAQFGGEAMEGLHHDTARGGVVFHFSSRRRAARSRSRMPAAVPAGCCAKAPS